MDNRESTTENWGTKALLPIHKTKPKRSRTSQNEHNWMFYCLVFLNISTLFWCYRRTARRTDAVFIVRNEQTFVDSCTAPLPTLFAQHPPSSGQADLEAAAKSFDKALDRFYQEKKPDSVAVAVVTSAGSIYEGFRGVLHANETSDELSGNVDRHSIYRIASVSKLFTCLETLILRNLGALSLDDPISKFIPELDYMTQEHSLADKKEEAITFRQLMSHMAGLGREHPDGDASGYWPEALGPNAPAGLNGHSFPNVTGLLEAIANRHLIMTPYKFPSYSNSGFGLLGAAILAAAQKFEGDSAPTSYAELVQRDIFDKLGFEDSSFLADDSNRDRVVVSSSAPWEVDLDFKGSNPTGGQMSSLSDFVTLATTFLDPTKPKALLPPVTMLEWLRPLHNFGDGITSVGMPWEITRIKSPFLRTIEQYTKGGALAAQYSSFAVIPTHSFAVVVLTAHKERLSSEIHKIVMDHFLPAFDKALMKATEEHLAGTWTTDDGAVELHILATAGAVYATRYIVNGTDALTTLNDNKKPGVLGVPIWSVGNDEFRLRPTQQSTDLTGCEFDWLTLDEFTYMNGYAVNLVRLVSHETDPKKNRLEVPAMGVTLRRT